MTYYMYETAFMCAMTNYEYETAFMRAMMRYMREAAFTCAVTHYLTVIVMYLDCTLTADNVIACERCGVHGDGIYQSTHPEICRGLESVQFVSSDTQTKRYIRMTYVIHNVLHIRNT